MKCENCGEDHDVLYARAKCHPNASLTVVIYPKLKVVEVLCSECNQLVVGFGWTVMK